MRTKTKKPPLNHAIQSRLQWLAYPSAVGVVTDTIWKQCVANACEQLGLDSTCDWSDDNEFLCAWNSEDVYFAFRGTDRAFDWAVNARITDRGKLPVAGVHCHGGHAGYTYSLDAVWDLVYELLREHRGKRLHWTGHSKGGAMASLACTRAWAGGYRATTCYTFGEPANSSSGLAKLGDHYATRFDRRRYVCCQDAVPWTPFFAQRTGLLRHWGDVYYLDRRGELRKKHSQSWMMFDAAIDCLTSGPQWITDHSSTDYWLLTKHAEA